MSIIIPNKILHNRYKIIGKLGGRFNRSVYRARDMNYPDVRKFVALKSVVPYEGTIEERFRREVDILRLAEHPSLPQFIDSFEEDDNFCLVTTYINGSDMERLLRQPTKIFPVEMIIKWGIQLCDVISYLHSSPTAPLVARNIRLSNIMVDSFGNVFLTDLSNCAFLGVNEKIINDFFCFYDDGYTAPEWFTWSFKIQGDIYSMGALLHYILTRQHPRLRPPFSFAEYPVQQFNPDAPAELNDVIQQAVAFEPENRFQSAAEMKTALEQIRL